jgi:hypothetical protein
MFTIQLQLGKNVKFTVKAPAAVVFLILSMFA